MARQMTEEQKKAAAERMKAARAAKAKLAAETSATAPAQDKEPASPKAKDTAPAAVSENGMVKILYVDSCITNNQIPIGRNRYIYGSGRMFTIPLQEFEGEFMTPLSMKLLEKRKFIVLDGLTDEQRKLYGCLYKENEVIKTEGIFDWLLTGPEDDAGERFSALCWEHKQMAAKRFIDAFEKNDNRISRSRVERLNKISRDASPDGKGLFTPILEELNARAV